MEKKFVPYDGMKVRWVTPEEDAVQAKYVMERLVPICGTSEMTLDRVKPVERSDEYIATLCRNGEPLRYKGPTTIWHSPSRATKHAITLKSRTVRVQCYLLRPV